MIDDKSQELDQNSVSRNFRITASDGKNYNNLTLLKPLPYPVSLALDQIYLPKRSETINILALIAKIKTN